MSESIKYIKEPGSGEYVDRKSRFIAEMCFCETEESAEEFIKAEKKKYYDAKHHCFAYIIGNAKEIKRYSDDGEPQRTAGMPIMDVINGSGLTNICIVVTRYFGGTLLGPGGLVRAYQGAAKLALENAVIGEQKDSLIVTFVTNYKASNAVLNYCQTNSVEILETVYLEEVTFKCLIFPENEEKFITDITNLTLGSVNIVDKERRFV
ncbi:MAG: YigZ family protein [Lachnospiraceae bacterium]|nr:YigZ family protein [Lachnospiraceae bacterium]